MNRKKVQRLWREEGLRVPPKRHKRRRLGASTTPADRLRAEPVRSRVHWVRGAGVSMLSFVLGGGEHAEGGMRSVVVERGAPIGDEHLGFEHVELFADPSESLRRRSRGRFNHQPSSPSGLINQRGPVSVSPRPTDATLPNRAHGVRQRRVTPDGYARRALGQPPVGRRSGSTRANQLSRLPPSVQRCPQQSFVVKVVRRRQRVRSADVWRPVAQADAAAMPYAYALLMPGSASS